jgi:mono/diheme cytochrome c family protein/uncharacterized membrane protein
MTIPLSAPAGAIPARTGRTALCRVVVCTLLLGAGQGRALASNPAPAESPAALAARVRALFAAKCAECHGPNLPRPHGGFGYVLDLQRVAGNPALVVPFRPAASRLWELVRDGEMPPEGARGGPLTPGEKEAIRSWIAAGAADLAGRPFSDASLAQAEPGESRPSEPRPLTPARRVLRWIGRLHVMLIHFPIALLMAAAVGELWSVWRDSQALRTAVRFCVLLGAGAGVGAVTLGWLHADVGGYGAGSPQILAQHRWLGTAAGLWAVGVALLSEVESRRGRRSRLFRLLLCAGALLAGAAAHLGGTLVHGETFFDW